MDDKLFQAILAMDSYNRGYNAGIIFGSNPLDSEAIPNVTQIGNVTVYRSDESPDAQAVGFYAIAYKYPDGHVTISYRGTDDLNGTLGHLYTDGDFLSKGSE